MKRTLLFFLLLFTHLFYAQSKNIVHCPGDNTFDLAKQKTLLIGNLDPNQTVVSFHLSLADATNNANAIADPSNYYTTASSTTIYVRINNNGTITTNSFNVVVNPSLNITVTHTPIFCKGGTSSLSITASGGSGQYYYAIEGNSFKSSNKFDLVSAGVYTIQVLDAVAGCPTKINYTITEPVGVTATYMLANQNIVVINAAGGTSPYQYSLDGINYQVSNAFPGLVPGDYDIRARDAQGCETIVRANVPPFLHAAVAITKESDCIGNGNNAEIDIHAIGGQAPYLYSLNNGYSYQPLNIFSNLSDGTYSVIVKDALNSVTNPTSITISPPVPVNGVALVTNATSCNSAFMTIQATAGKAPFYYSIDNGITFTHSNIFNNLTPGNYTFLIKDSKNCVSSALFNQVQQPPSPLLATVSNTPLVCAKDKTILTINATGGQTPYRYSLNGGPFTATNAYNITNGTYFIRVKDDVGCFVSVEYLIAQPTPIYPDILIEGRNVTLNGQAGTAPYQYSIDSGAYQSENVFNNLTPGNHTLFLKDSKGCESYPFTVIIQDPNPVAFTFSTIKQEDCSGNTQINIAATGGQAPYYYSISYSSNETSYQSGNIFSKIPPGTYYLTVKDALNSVSSTSSIIISEPVPVTATVAHTAILCADETSSLTITTLTGEAPFQYSLNNGAYTNGNTFTKLKAGTYTINVKDKNSCLISLSHTITEPPVLFGEILVEGQTISFIDVKGGTGSYQYAIGKGNFQSNSVFTNVAIGHHTLRLKDSNNCEPVIFSALVAAPLIATTTVTKPVSCISNAEITVDAKGGYDPYTYSIDGGLTYQSNNTFTNIPAGTYTIKVMDNADNISNSNVIVIDPPADINAVAYSTPVDCINNTILTIDAIGGKVPYQYSINYGTYTNSNIYTNISPGTYNISVKDANACVYTFVYTVLPTNIIIGAIDTEGQTVTVINVSGGNGSYLYSLDNGSFQTNPVFTNLTFGLHRIKIKDSIGCESPYEISFLIEDSNSLTSTTVITKSIDCLSNAIIAVTASGGKTPYLYSIDGGVTYQKNNVFNNLIAGAYNVQVKDTIGNTSANNLVVPAYLPITTSFDYKNVSCVGSNDGSIHIIAEGGIAPYTYSLNDSTYSLNDVITNLVAGNYIFSVKDAAGCISTKIVTIQEPSVLSITSSTTNSTSSVANDGKITTNAIGGVPPYAYALTDNNGILVSSFQTSNVFAGLKAGVYSTQVKDSNGCISSQANITISSSSNSLLVFFTTTPATCLNTLGTINITASGGVAPYQYSIDGINYFSTNIFTLTAGIYTLTIRDAENNLYLTIAEITQINSPSALATVTSNVLCKGDNTGSIALNITGGQSPYSYSINGAPFNSTNTFTNLRAGTYNITVKDTNGCMSTTTSTINEPAEALSVTAFPVNDQSIIANAKGGTAPYLYYLQNSNGVVVAGPQDHGIFARLPLGLYGAQVTDANGCGYIISGINVIPTPPLSATIDIVPGTCINAGTITVNATGGFQPYYYSYDNGVTYTISNVYSSYTPGNYSIKVRDYKNTIVSFSAVLNAGNTPLIKVISTTNVKCKGQADGSATIEANGGKAPYLYSLDHGSYISSANNITFSNLLAGNHIITIKDANGCEAIAQVSITEPTLALTNLIEVKNQTIRVNTAGGTGEIKYAISPNLDKFSTNNTFPSLTPGFYTVLIMDTNGCFVSMDVLVDPPAPLLEGQNKFTIEFKPGQTLADLIIDGQNIKWYLNQNPLGGKSNKTSETQLPSTTVLVDGMTYYASQTINGIESKERLAVTVKLDKSLSTTDVVLPNFKYYPNPVQHTLAVDNTTTIDEIEILSVSGKSVLTKKINNTHSEIDLSNVSSGFYFLKVKAEGQVKTIKIVKK